MIGTEDGYWFSFIDVTEGPIILEIHHWGNPSVSAKCERTENLQDVFEEIVDLLREFSA